MNRVNYNIMLFNYKKKKIAPKRILENTNKRVLKLRT